MNNCTLCPRNCHADRRDGKLGYCGVDDRLRVARVAPHYWEEPLISGTRGAGAVFFSGCSLRCIYCQNHDLSHEAVGKTVTESELCNMIFKLANTGVHCIEFVTPTHYADKLINVLKTVRAEISLPIVWNSGGYEKAETLRRLDGLIDVYLPDFKYFSSDIAEKYSDADDYCDVALKALSEMYRQTGKCVFNPDGIIKKGIIVRHLVLPGGREDSCRVLKALADTLGVADIRLSLMSQYTPDFAKAAKYRELHRRITSFEYKYVLSYAEDLGFKGYFQDRSSADKKYTPEFGENI